MATKRSSRTNGQPKRGLALLFPGQGSQHAGMGKRIFETSKAARRVFNEADDAVGFSLSKLCFGGSEEELEATVNTQPAIVATSLAYLAELRERLSERGRQLKPSFVAGHSLGQFSAAIAAGALAFSDGLQIVMERGRIMGEWSRNRPGGMATVLGLKDEQVAYVCRAAAPDGSVGVAVYNGPGHTVISGDVGPLQRAMQLARERGARVLRLPISVPGHMPLMQDAARELSLSIDALPFHDPQPPLVSNMSAKLLTRADEVRQELSDQICKAVQWARCVTAMADQGTGTFVEVGPGQVLSKLVHRILGDEAHGLSAERASTEELLGLAGASFDSVPSSVPLEAAG